MPRRRNTDPGSEPANASDLLANHLYPTDRTRVRCQMCSMEVPNIPLHLSQIHPTATIEEYQAEFPRAPLYGETPSPQSQRRQRVRVSTREIESHPGGYEAALNEKKLAPDERQAYRNDIQDLINKGYPPGYQIASAAYFMALARRVRTQIEEIRERARGQILDSTSLKTLRELEGVIASHLSDLEKTRLSRVDKENPLKVHEDELDEAERWIARHQGEFVEQCGNCNAPLVAPSLPHWAFRPITTSRGVEWPVWSPELWRLVRTGTIQLWVMAYVLRTSPEGLKWTCLRRGEPWPEAEIDLEREERILRRILETHDMPEAPVPQEQVAAISAAVQSMANSVNE